MAKKSAVVEKLPISSAEAKEIKSTLIQQILSTTPVAATDLVEQKLRLLYELQVVDSEIDNIRILRGELPNEVNSLEDEVIGLETRISNTLADIKKFDTAIVQYKLNIEAAKTAIEKYEVQQKNVRNNREFETLTKEIEFQKLEVELLEKNIRDTTVLIKEKKSIKEATALKLEDRKSDLLSKQKELEQIVEKTEQEENALKAKSEQYVAVIEDRLLNAYYRLRNNARNGLAVVEVRRDACGGCFNKIPPQRQADIKLAKRVIACEYCGRILVDWELPDQLGIED